MTVRVRATVPPAGRALPAIRTVVGTLRQRCLSLPAIERLLPAIFAAYAIPLTIFFAVALPTFRIYDEYWHFARAEQIGTGGLLTWRQNSPGAGGIVDTNIVRLDALLSTQLDRRRLTKRSELHRLDAAQLREVGAIAWGGERRFVDLQGIGPYPPFLYAPAVAAIWVGKGFHLSISSTVTLTRLTNAAVAISAGVIALLLMPYARAALFAVLALPITLHQFASASQDAMLISLTALIGALAARALHARRPLRRAELIGVSVLIGAIAMARPPMLAAALLLLIPGLADSRRWPRTGVLWVAGIALATLAWVGYAATYSSNTVGHLGTPVYPMRQLAALLEQPLRFLTLVGETWRVSGENLTRHFIGELGWFEVILPASYYRFMLAILACALLAGLFERKAARWPASAIIGTAVVAGGLGMLLILYLIWTPQGWTYIEGPQGRYFLPLALLLCAGLPALGAGAIPRALLTCVVAAAPLVTLAVVPWAVIARYYLAPD